MKRLRAAAYAAAVSLALTGCVKQNNHYTVYPDGSGKVSVETIVSGQLAMLLQGMLGGGFGGPRGEGAPTPEEALKDAFRLEGIVAWKDLKVDKLDGGQKLKISGVGYFEDANEIRTQSEALTFKALGADGGEGTRTKAEAGYELTMKTQLGGGRGGMPGPRPGPDGIPPEQREMALAMARMMLAGFESKTTITMPGTITEATPLGTTEGRDAKVVLTADDVLKRIEEGGKAQNESRITCGPEAEDLAAEWEAFKAEMAEAKAQAEKEKAEAEKKEQEKEKDGEKKPAEPEEKPEPEEF